MPEDKGSVRKRKRMVVEEVTDDSSSETQSETASGFDSSITTPESPSDIRSPLENVKEKVEELHEITEDLSEDVAKSEDVQEEIAKAVSEVSPKAETTYTDDEPFESPSSQIVAEDPIKSPEAVSETVPQLKKSSTNPLIIIIPGLFLLGALLGGIYFYQKGVVANPKPSPEPTEPTTVTVTPQASASPQPTAPLDLTKYPVSVLNGSGIPGEAGKVKDILTAGGYKVSGTANAANYGFTKTVIKAKSDVPQAFLTQLSTLLGKTYSLDANQSLPAGAGASIEITVGSEKSK